MEALLLRENLFYKKKIKGKTFYTIVCSYCGQEVTYEHGKKLEECPHCEERDYKKPVTETKLFLLQKKYLENRSKKVLGEMYKILVEYAQSIAKKLLPRDFKYHFDKIEEKSRDAATLLIEYYLEKPSFKIDNSFGGYLKWKVKEALWNKKTRIEEDHISLYSNVSEEKDMFELSEMLDISPIFSDEEKYYEDERSKKDLLKGIEGIIESICIEVKKEHSIFTVLLLLLGLSVRIKNNKNDLNIFYTYFSSDIKKYVDQSMLLIFQFIKEH